MASGAVVQGDFPRAKSDIEVLAQLLSVCPWQVQTFVCHAFLLSMVAKNVSNGVITLRCINLYGPN
jgi:hypothetical protein